MTGFGYHGDDFSKSEIPKGDLFMLYSLTTAAPAVQGDPVALAMILVLGMVVAVMAYRKHTSKKNKEIQAAQTLAAAPVPETPAPTAPGSAGKLKLHDVEPKTAAILMAIVADQLGKPLNELRFISIKEVK